MPARLQTGAFALGLSGAALLLAPAPALAQPVGIEFGSSAGEEVLDGGTGWSPPALQAPRPIAHPETVRAHVRYPSTQRSVTYAGPRSTFIRGTGVFANANPGGGSVIYVHTRPPAPSVGSPGPRIIDVEEERLDRRTIASGRSSVIHVGSAKIIRLAPDRPQNAALERETEIAALPAPRSVTDSPRGAAPAPALPYEVEPLERTETPVPVREAEDAAFLEPWSDAWARDCQARHASFDAALGTYLGADGHRRFCTGEPG